MFFPDYFSGEVDRVGPVKTRSRGTPTGEGVVVCGFRGVWVGIGMGAGLHWGDPVDLVKVPVGSEGQQRFSRAIEDFNGWS